MNADLTFPVVRECLQLLRSEGISREDLVRNSGAHHFCGFSLWFRNRFCHSPDAPLKHFSWDPDSVSSLFTRLLIEHWECSEDDWRVILTNTHATDPFSNFQKVSQLVINPDDEL